MRTKKYRRLQRKRIIKKRLQALQEARGFGRWWVPGLRHEGSYSKHKPYMGPYELEDKESNLKRRNERQGPEMKHFIGGLYTIKQAAEALRKLGNTGIKVK